MPLVRIDLAKTSTPELRKAVSETVYNAMTEIANVPQHDKFQIITLHDSDQMIYPAEGYLGVSYTPNIVFIHVTWVAGRSTDVKKAFYKKIADDLHAKAGIRKEDVFIVLSDTAREDWSFGGGLMQYAPK
ncbi:MAG: tautomerase family protein [Bradyrhizobiaceae bacterium]|nr:MAG: tautomerase family protein [Bradyrhizobiaceae bacterium]